MKVETVIGDKAYSSKENVDAAKDNHYELISRLNSIVTQGNRIKPDEFEFNKDARMYQCKAGHLAIHKYLDKRKKSRKESSNDILFRYRKNVKDVFIRRVVIKKEQKGKPTQKH